VARNYNKVLLIGTVNSIPVLRKTTNNTSVTNFTLITTNNWVDSNGQKQIYKKWHHIVCWGKLAENVASHISAESIVLVEGSISYRYYMKDNIRLKVAEIKATSVSNWEGSLNKIIIVGNVASDSTLRKTTNNTNVTNLTISTVDKWQDKNDEVQFNKKWHQIVCWGKTAEQVVDKVENGALVLVEGSISYKTYINKDNIKNNHIAEIKASQLTKWATGSYNTTSQEREIYANNK
jgi:single-strand DNA-binding protein